MQILLQPGNKISFYNTAVILRNRFLTLNAKDIMPESSEASTGFSELVYLLRPEGSCFFPKCWPPLRHVRWIWLQRMTVDLRGSQALLVPLRNATQHIENLFLSSQGLQKTLACLLSLPWEKLHVLQCSAAFSYYGVDVQESSKTVVESQICGQPIRHD